MAFLTSELCIGPSGSVVKQIRISLLGHMTANETLKVNLRLTFNGIQPSSSILPIKL